MFFMIKIKNLYNDIDIDIMIMIIKFSSCILILNNYNNKNISINYLIIQVLYLLKMITKDVRNFDDNILYIFFKYYLNYYKFCKM